MLTLVLLGVIAILVGIVVLAFGVIGTVISVVGPILGTLITIAAAATAVIFVIKLTMELLRKL